MFLSSAGGLVAVFIEIKQRRKSSGSHGPASFPATASSLPHNGISRVYFCKFDTQNSMDSGARGRGQGCARKSCMCTCAPPGRTARGVTRRACESLTGSAHSAQRGANLERHRQRTSCFRCCKETVLQLNYLL